MDELKELHIRGVLSDKGYLKETYDNELNDLKHKLTDKGQDKLKEFLRDPESRKQFMRLAIEEAAKHPGNEKAILQGAINKIREFQ